MKTMYFSFGMIAGIALMLLGFGCNKSGVINEASPMAGTETRSSAFGDEDAQTTFCTDCQVDDLVGEPASEFANVVARYRDNHQKLFDAFARHDLNNSVYPNSGTQVNGVFQDTRSCMFSIDRIKKFICLTERYAARLNMNTSKLGLRFYYGIYPSNYYREPQYSNMHTLYITVTYRNSAGKYVDFDPRKSVTNGTIVPLYQLILLNEPDMFVLGGRSGAQPPPPGGSLNHGDLCPPGTGCDSTLSVVDQMAPLRPLDQVFYY